MNASPLAPDIVRHSLVRSTACAIAPLHRAATLLLALAGFTVTRLALVERLAGRRR